MEQPAPVTGYGRYWSALLRRDAAALGAPPAADEWDGVYVETVLGMLPRRKFDPVGGGTTADWAAIERHWAARAADPDGPVGADEAPAAVAATRWLFGECKAVADISANRLGDPAGRLIADLSTELRLGPADANALTAAAESFAATRRQAYESRR
jgi:hypothetical protein